MNASQSRLAFRLAFRRAWRRPARTVLVVALVALPVAGMALASTLSRSTLAETDQRREWAHGRAGSVYHADPRVPLEEARRNLTAAVGPDARQVVTHTASVFAQTDNGIADVLVLARPAADPLLEGTLLLRGGRYADAPEEIALSSAALEALEAKVGDTVDAGATTRQIVGVLAYPPQLNAHVAQVAAGALPAGASRTDTAVFVDRPRLPVIPRGWSPAFLADSEKSYAHPAIYLATGIVLLVGAIVAATAFAVSTRRHLRELGVLLATGATPGQLVWLQATDGVVLGLLGSSIGVVFGAALSVAMSSRLDVLANHATEGLRWSALDVVAGIGLGTVAAAVAAWIPARAAFSLPALSALAGRRPAAARGVRQLSWVGLAMVVLGAGLLAWISRLEFAGDLWSFSLVAVGLIVLGTVMLVVRIVAGVEVLSRVGSGITRLGLRSVARQRSRSAAVVAAVMAVGGLCIGWSAVLLSTEAENEVGFGSTVGDDQVVIGVDAPFANRLDAIPEAAVARLSALLPGSARAEQLVATETGTDRAGLRTATPAIALIAEPSVVRARYRGRFNYPIPTTLSVGTPELLDALGAPAPTAAVLARGRVAVFGPEARPSTEVRIVVGSARRPGVPPPILPSEVVATSRSSLWGRAVIAREQLAPLGMDSHLQNVHFRSPQPLTEEQRDDVRRFSRAISGAVPAASRLSVLWHQPAPSSATPRLVVTGIGLAFTLGVVALGLALIAAEGRAEDAVLAALGASQRAAARLRAVQAGSLTVLGGLLAIPIGFLPVWVVLKSSFDGSVLLPTRFPTATALAVALVIPLLASAAAAGHAYLLPGRAVPLSLLAEDE